VEIGLQSYWVALSFYVHSDFENSNIICYLILKLRVGGGRTLYITKSSAEVGQRAESVPSPESNLRALEGLQRISRQWNICLYLACGVCVFNSFIDWYTKLHIFIAHNLMKTYTYTHRTIDQNKMVTHKVVCSKVSLCSFKKLLFLW
jgi:hypothetical protein